MTETTGVELSVLVPVYNNAATLDELIDRLLAVLQRLGRSFEIVMVDDGSSDDSLGTIRRRAATEPRIRPFAMIRNFGSQAASCAACDQARGRIIVHIDADLENFPEDIPRLLEYFDRGHDLVCGFREQRRGAWLTRRLPSFLINSYVRRRTGLQIADVGCGLRVLDAQLVRNLEAEGEARRLLTPVLLRRAQRIAEVPVRHRPKAGRGGHSFATLLGIAADYYLVTARRPFLVTGLLSGIATAAGVVLFVLGPGLPPLVVITGGLLGALLSLVGEYCQRLYQLAQGTPFYELRDLDAKAEVETGHQEPALAREG